MKFLNISKTLQSKRGEIGTIVILVGMAVIGLGILVGSQVRDGRINFLPRASTDLTQAASIWNNVKPGPGNIYPWTNGGPTTGWESYAANFAYICNLKYCWVFNRNTLSWNNNGSPIVLDQDPGYNTVRGGPTGQLPWSNNGPTAAWTWKVTSNDQPATETLLCNGNYCWRYLRYPDGSATPSGWRDGGAPIHLPTANDFWKDSRVASLWSGNGVTVAWTDPVNSRVTLCNGNDCRSLDYQNWQWRFNGEKIQPYPPNSGITEFTSAWTSPATNIISQCNKNICWLFDIAAAKYSDAPIILTQTPPTNTPVPIKTNTPIPARTNTPVPIRTNTPIPVAIYCTDTDNGLNYSTKGSVTGNGLGCGTTASTDLCANATVLNEQHCGSSKQCFTSAYTCPNGCKDGVCLPSPTSNLPTARPPYPSTELWNSVQPITVSGVNIYPWSNGGPTAGWESYIANFAYICNGKYCWTLDRNKLAWLNEGKPFEMDKDPAYQVKASNINTYPWSNGGPTAAWTWILPYNGYTVNEAVICNGNYCWRYLRYPNGVAGSGWRDGGAPIYLPTYNDFWKDSRVAQLWTGNGITVAWTDPINSRVTLCNRSDCRSLDYKNWQWRFDGAKIQPFPPNSGLTEYTSAWTSPTTNIISLCNKNVCWQYDIPAAGYASSPVTLISTKATPTVATITQKPNAKPAITSYTWKPQVPVIGDTVTATITGTDADSSQVSIEVHVYGQGYPDTVFAKGNAVVSGGKWTFTVTKTIPGFTGKFTTYVIMNDGINSVKSGNYEVSVVVPTPKDTCPRKREGDANCDSRIDILDISCWIRESLGSKPQGCISADFNSNGIVSYEKDFLDLSIWRTTYIKENSVLK